MEVYVGLFFIFYSISDINFRLCVYHTQQIYFLVCGIFSPFNLFTLHNESADLPANGKNAPSTASLWFYDLLILFNVNYVDSDVDATVNCEDSACVNSNTSLNW